MNARRERFCLEYAASGNATKAAVSAGYSPQTARSQGQRLLTNADVKARIEELQQEMRRERIADIDAIQTFWTAILKDPNAKTADRLKASELLARSRGAFLKSEGCQGPRDGADWNDVVVCLPDNGREDNTPNEP